MDDSLCRRFFVEPTQTGQRRYEALRLFFVDGLSYHLVAARLHRTYHSVRSLVRDFRAQCQAGQVPPFLSKRAGDGRKTTTRRSRRGWRRRPSRTHAS